MERFFFTIIINQNIIESINWIPTKQYLQPSINFLLFYFIKSNIEWDLRFYSKKY